MKKVLLFFFTAIALGNQLHSQASCTATSFNVDLSASIDTSVSIQSTRNGDCCNGTNCIKFNLTINPACSYVNFTVANPAPPGNAAYYQIDCGPQTSLGTPVCVVGKTTVTITFCKPGNDNPIYTIVAAGALEGSDDITVREGCTGSMSVSGLLPATINWTSIFPGTQGTYDSYLSCTSGCIFTNVTPLQGPPSFIDYQVSGNRVCGPVVYDTIRVYTNPQIAVAITPDNSSVCAGGSTNAALFATATGGDAPYVFLWDTGQSGEFISVNAGGTYTVSVTDTNNCLPAVQSVIITTIPLPAAPVITTNSPVCEGGSLNLSASTVAGATYNWTGPNGFTSSLQNPVINNVNTTDAGSYSVTVKVGQCSSYAASTSVIVNSIPASPILTINSPVCEGTNLNLTASAMAGAVYSWTGPNGFTSSVQNPVINNISLVNAGVYYVTATINGCTSASSSTTALIHPLPSAPFASSNSPLCNGSTISLMANTINQASYLWAGPNGFTAMAQNPIILNVGVNSSGTYSVRASVNGCTGPAGTVSVIVNPIPPAPAVSSNGPVCEGSLLSLSASSIAGAAYSWTGPLGFSSSLQNPSILNPATAASGNYSVTATVNGCASASNTIAVIVKPIPSPPVVTGNSTLCEGSTLSLNVSAITGATYSWSGPNGFVSSSQNIFIPNVAPEHSGVYAVTAIVNGCASPGEGRNVTVNLNPESPSVSSNSPVCSGASLLLTASGVAGAIYNWTGPAGFTSAEQNPVIPNTSLANDGTYSVSVSVNGCSSISPSLTLVDINQTPAVPAANNNGPLCEGEVLNLTATNVNGAIYSWNGPNGFVSSSQNNSLTGITAANEGSYYVTATVNGCTSISGNTNVIINWPAIANAGTDQAVCSSDQFISVAGVLSGGRTEGLWTSNGSGTFLPGNTSLQTNYYPSAADKAAGNIVLTLSSTNNGVCPVSSSSVLIRFTQLPTVNAGNNQTVCANNSDVLLNGQYSNAGGFLWSSTGTGRFSPSPTGQNATYFPSTGDLTNGIVKLILTTTGNGPCAAVSDTVVVRIQAPPVINMRSVEYVMEKNTIILNPFIQGSNLKFTWTPGIYLNNDTIANPICTPGSDVSYKLIAKDALGCSSTADVMVKLLKQPEIPNVFTPNGDGINDRWQIKNLADYPECTVEIYNRYGQVVYQSIGYSREWDGTSKGKPLPAATYYYIINQKIGLKTIAGFVDILR